MWYRLGHLGGFQKKKLTNTERICMDTLRSLFCDTGHLAIAFPFPMV
jgi:hypothetical protein